MLFLHEIGLREVKLNSCAVRLKEISENFKIPIWIEGTLS